MEEHGPVIRQARFRSRPAPFSRNPWEPAEERKQRSHCKGSSRYNNKSGGFEPRMTSRCNRKQRQSSEKGGLDWCKALDPPHPGPPGFHYERQTPGWCTELGK